MTGIQRPLLHFAFCTDEGYAPYIAVALRSLLRSHPLTPIVIHLLHDGLSPRMERSLQAEVEHYGPLAELRLYPIDVRPLHCVPGKHLQTWYRLLLPQTLPVGVEKVLFLDGDTLVMENLSPLFALDMEGKSVAAVSDTQTFCPDTFQRCRYAMEDGYFCAGVLMMNLSYWRMHHVAEDAIAVGQKEGSRLLFADQDALNIVCRKSKLLLPLRYNVTDGLFTQSAIYLPPLRDEAVEAALRPAIIHYAGAAPWLRDVDHHPFASLWYACESLSSHTVPRRWESRGLTRLKVMLWNALHPSRQRCKITMAEIRRRLALPTES